MLFLKDSLLFDNTNCSQPLFLWYCHCFTGALERILFVKGSVSVSEYLLQPSILSSRLWLLQENWKSTVVYLRRAFAALLFLKGSFWFHRTRYTNFCLKGTMHNVQKYLQPFILPWWLFQFDKSSCSCSFLISNSNCTYPFWQVQSFS